MDKKQLLEDDLKYIWRPFTQMKALEKDENKPIIIKKGKGIYLEDIDGNKYIDAVSSWWVNTLGHSNNRINKTINKQLKKIEHVIFGGFSHEPVIHFSKKPFLKLRIIIPQIGIIVKSLYAYRARRAAHRTRAS